MPGEFHGHRNLVGYSPWGHKELDMTLRLTQYSIVYTYHIFFIFPSSDGHLDCFHVLAIVNSAATNIAPSTLNMSSYCLLASMISSKKLAFNLSGDPLDMFSHFPLVAFLGGFGHFEYTISEYGSLSFHTTWSSLSFLDV